MVSKLPERALMAEYGEAPRLMSVASCGVESGLEASPPPTAASLLFSLQLYVDRVVLDPVTRAPASLLLAFQLLQYEIVVLDAAVACSGAQAAETRLRCGKSCLFEADAAELARELRREAEAPLTLLLLAPEHGRARLRAFAAVPLSLHVGLLDGDELRGGSLLRVSEWAGSSGDWELRDHCNGLAGHVTGVVTLSCLGKTLAPHLAQALGLQVSKELPPSPRTAADENQAKEQAEGPATAVGAAAEVKEVGQQAQTSPEPAVKGIPKVEKTDSSVQCEEDMFDEDSSSAQDGKTQRRTKSSNGEGPILYYKSDSTRKSAATPRRTTQLRSQNLSAAATKGDLLFPRDLPPPLFFQKAPRGRSARTSRESLSETALKRFFRLTRTELMYFKAPEDSAPRRRYELTLDSSVLRSNDQGYALCIVFQSAPGQPQFYMQAENEVEKDEWITAIYNAYRRTPDVSRQTSIPEIPKVVDPSPSASAMPEPPPAPVPVAPSRTMLEGVIHGARRLKAADMNGKSDPYCVVKLVGKDGQIIDVEEKRTDYITATLDPVWDKPFLIGRVVDLNLVKAVRFELWDHDTFKNNDSLGSVEIPFTRFHTSPASTFQSEPIDDWFRVEPPKKISLSSFRRNDTREKEHAIRDWGELHIRMSLTGPNLVDFLHSSDLAFVPTSPVATASDDHSDNRLEVTVIAAKDLISADVNKSSDPYCELTLLDAHEKPILGEYATTAIMHRTRNPAWANEHHVFGLISPISKAASLKVRVIDYDKSNRNDPLGFICISLDQLSAHKWTEWHVLQPEEGMSVRENLGAIQLQMWLIGERRGEHVRQLQIDKEVKMKTHNQSVEELELENAQYQFHDAACMLDGARIPCAVADYQARDPRFYGINGCIHYLNTQIPRAHREKTSTDESFQARSGLEGLAQLEVAVVQTSDLVKPNTDPKQSTSLPTPYAVIEMDPSGCVEECKRTSAPLSARKSKRIAAAAGDERNTMFSKRAQAEVSVHRAKLVKNEMRSEKSMEINPDKPILKVEILTGHGLSPADMNGYSDPSTPLGRVEIPLYDLCRASADLTSISSRDIVKRYELKPEPWMKKHAKDLGELCIKTEVVGDATVLAELMQRVSNIPMEKSLSILSFSEANIQSDASMNMSMSAVDLGESELEDETTEVIPRGAFIQTSTSKVISVGDPPKAKATWRKEKFSLSLSYPGVFRDAKYPTIETHSLHLRVHEARNLSLPDTVSNNPDRAVPVTVDFDAESGKSSQVVFAHPNKGRLQGATSIYFTVIPVLGDGTLVDTERQQSLTVYNTRDPSWPEQDFTFGKFKDISNVSYLSLHLYERDLQNDKSKPLSRLLTDKEKEMNARLRRFQLHKLSPSGEVDDNGFDILQYGQRVLAFRCCHDSGRFECGRFYPARVQNYIPFPHDEYDVLFEDAIETINELRNFISFDVQGIVQAVRNDGRVDVNVESANGNVTKRNVRFIAQPTQLIPVNSITEKVKMVMARRVEKKTEQKDRWVKMKHKLSGIAIDVMSASDLLLPVNGQDQQQLKLEPACRVTLLAIPNQTECIDTNDNDGIQINDRGELIPTDSMSSSKWTWKTGKPLEAIVKHAESQSNDRHLFEQSPLVIGNVGSSPEGEIDYSPVDPQEAQRGVQLLKRVSSIIIQVVVGVETDVKSVGYVKVDLATLQVGHQDLQLRIIPPSNVPYVKFGGTVFLHIATWSNSKATAVEASIKVDLRTPSLSVTGLTDWYNRQAQLEAETSTLNNRGITWIERRQILRASLRPTENSQIDALHTVLVIIMKRIVDILREIRQFEDYETLSVDEMLKCRKVHTVNSNLNSEFLGRTMDKLSHEVRKEIVVGLENELLSLAGLRGISPEANCSREEWVRVRTERQKLLREKGDFFMRDQTSALVLSVPRSFTGEGMISWILRKPPVLWEDKWKIYCKDVKTQRSCHLGWNDPGLEVDPDAIQAPKERLYALQWMSALCAAGFVENVTPSIVALTELGKRNALMEVRTDRFYRLREVDMWMEKKIRDKSLFPLDLVQEFDCHRSLEYADEKSGALTSEELIDKSDDEKMPAKERQATIKRRKTYAKKLTDHCDGFLGMPTLLSNFIFSLEANKKHTVAETTEKLVDHLNVVENILWDWKYCLFVPHRKHLYMYEHVSSTAPVAFIDMASGACRVAYNSKNDGKGGWMDIVNPTVCVRKSDSHEFVPVCSEMLDKMTINRDNGDKVIEVKTKNAQRWIQMLSRAGVRVDMCPGQVVLLKQLNPLVLQQKCIDLATQFDRDDLEGSFQRLLNRFFEHDRESSYNEHDRKARELRAQVRSELKKPGGVDDTVMAYFGNGQLKSKPKYSGNFKKNSLYTGRILRIRSPYCDEEYPFKETYKVSEAPEPLRKLLTKYNVTDEKSWSNLPIMQRDMLLLYDIEYSHANERLVEEGLIRENIRTNEGDLDPKKVRDRCTDLNILFKATDLEDCVMRMVKHRYHHKPLGILKIPIKTISPHRTIDAWYSLAPANNMLKKSRLGQIRVELKLVQKRETKRSFRIPVPLASLMDKAPTSPKQGLSKLIPGSAKDKNTRLKSSFELGQEPSFVKISILEGRGLRVADLFTSDPFVEIVLLDEQDSIERDTNLKTDIKMKTLNPKWQNQEFLLGKTEKTKLSDKKGVLLRVMDYDATSANDPLGCVTIEFQRGETGYIRGLVLKQAGKENGSAVTEELKLNDDNRFDVEAALLPAAGQSKPSDGGLFSKKKTPGPDGLLGKLRFLVEIMRNENYVDPNLKKIETTFSAEVAIKNTDLHQEDWTEYKCYFQPHGEGGLRIQYNPASEDLGRGNSHKLSELLHSAASLLNCDKTGKVTSSFSDRDAFKILGRTYDLSKVDYFDVRVEGKGKVFVGHLGKSERKSQRKSDTKLDDKTFSLKYPTQRANFQDIKVALTEEQSKEIRTLTLDLNLIGILRADRVRRILSDTFRLVGLTFDPQTLNQNNGRHDSNQLQNDVDSFLWDTCRANIFPGRNTAKELLAQVRAMSQASKLHWKTTPQLLAYVFEFVFLNGEKDRLSFVNAVALDAVLNRWSHVLNNVAEAKDHLTGRLHGKKTPHLMEALFTECDWTGFDLSSLNNDSNRKVDGSQNPLRVGDRASAQLPLFKHVGVPVDVRLPGNEYAAAIIIRECTAGRCDIKLCATVDGNTSQTTKTAHETRKVLDRLGENSAYTEQVRRARVMQHDSKQHTIPPICLST
ncbi:unnamed protein product [Phytophthora lilii]|uniref:Unnamed protein product n=1 Tax=Phytophthora lilii TaxID=2077276 RepID=A0A9W6WQG8_9STRA|nr:unnamed protein product [Phytophthora lilii]